MLGDQSMFRLSRYDFISTTYTIYSKLVLIVKKQDTVLKLD
jgi:hypothetical protein